MPQRESIKFKLTLADPETGKTYSKMVERHEEVQYLLGKKIRDIIDGTPLGFEGYKLKITGGSDIWGFPMHPSINSDAKIKILSKEGIGFRLRRKKTKKRKVFRDGKIIEQKRTIVIKRPGMRKRKTVRGNTIGEFTYQVNIAIKEKGQKSIEECLATAESAA